MKTPSSDLFDLIKSLNSSEKKSFKIYANALGREKHSLYLQLFDAMDKQKHFDERALLRSLKGNDKIVKYFSAFKVYLEKQILNFLRIQDFQTHPDSPRNLLERAIAYFNKSNYKKSSQSLDIALEGAETENLWSLAIEIADWKLYLLNFEQPDIKAEQGLYWLEKIKVYESFQHEKRAFSRIDFETLHFRHPLKKTTILQTRTAADEYIRKEPYLNGSIQMETTIGKITQQNLLGTLHWAASNNDQAIEHSWKELNAYLEDEKWLYNNFRSFIYTLANFGMMAIKMQQFDRYLQFLEWQPNLAKVSIDDYHDHLALAANNKITYYFLSRNFEILFQLEDELLDPIRKYSKGNQSIHYLTCILMYSTAHILTGKNDIQDYVNEIQNRKEENGEFEIRCVLMVNMCIAYMRKGDIKSTGYWSDRLVERLNGKRNLLEQELIMYKFFKKFEQEGNISYSRFLKRNKSDWISQLQSVVPNSFRNPLYVYADFLKNENE